MIDIWYGILAPAGTPSAVIARLNTELNKALQSPDMKERFVAAGIQPLGNTPEQFAAYIKSEITKWAPVVKASGAKVD